LDEKTVSAEMTARLQQLRQQITIGVVGGSDLVKQKEQLGENGASSLSASAYFLLLKDTYGASCVCVSACSGK
jgi:hypothetical protein